MKDNVKFGVFALVAVLLPLAVGAGVGLPAWSYLVVAAVLLLLVWVLWSTRPESQERSALPIEPRPAVQTAPLQATVASGMDGYGFRLSATVRWRVIPSQGQIPHAAPSALAKDAVLQRAIGITSAFAPADHELARHRVAAALGAEESDQRRLVQVSAADVDLTIPEEQSEAVRTMADQRRQARLNEEAFAAERSIREYLGNEALRSTGSTLVWWLTRHLDNVEQAVELIDTLHRLSAVAQDDEDPGWPNGRIPAAPERLAAFGGVDSAVDGGNRGPEHDLLRLLDTMFSSGDPRRIRFVHELANLVADFDPATADRIRRLFGLHVVQPDEPDEDGLPTQDSVS